MLLIAPSIAAAQLQQGTIQGIVLGPDAAPVDGAVVTLLDGLGDLLMSAAAANGGRFRLTNVAPGTYSLRAEAPPLRAILQTLTVGGALPITVELRMSAVLAEQVQVEAEEPASVTTRVTLAGDAVRRVPARLRTRGLQDVIATTPGWATEDNGLLHVRGVDDGFLYVMDGVPVYERIDGLFGLAPDSAMIDSINVMTGYIPPEFGFKSGGVIEVRSAAGTSEGWAGMLDLSASSYATRDFSTMAGGPLRRTAALTLGMAGQTSTRFLDPTHPDNLHNQGGTLSSGGQFGWNLSPASTLAAVAGFGRSNFDVPHGEEQEEVGQDQRQRLRQNWQTLSWQHPWATNTISQVAGYHRFGSSALIGSPQDMPLFTNGDRDLRRVGVLASLTHQRGSHLLKVGGEAARLSLREDFRFAVTRHLLKPMGSQSKQAIVGPALEAVLAAAAERPPSNEDSPSGARSILGGLRRSFVTEEEALEADLSAEVIEHTLEKPFVFHETATPTLFSFYIQDSIRAVDHLTVDLGLRADWSRLLTSASQLSPRLGGAYHWPSTQTTLRGSFGRFFQPPQPENLLLASSEQARALSPFVEETGTGGGELRPERQTAVEAAVEQKFPRAVRLDVSYWHRWVRNAGDPNVLFGTTIIFPNTVDRGRASGVDVRLEMPRRRGWAGYLSYTNSRVVQFGPITGGLFLEDDVIEIGSGTAFTPDHDQRNVGAVGVTYDDQRRGFWTSLTSRYESGTPLEVATDALEELAERPGAELIDFDRQRMKPRSTIDILIGQRLYRASKFEVSARLSVLNAANHAFAYNFGNPFSGTHFGPGRTVAFSLRSVFR